MNRRLLNASTKQNESPSSTRVRLCVVHVKGIAIGLATSELCDDEAQVMRQISI